MRSNTFLCIKIYMRCLKEALTNNKHVLCFRIFEAFYVYSAEPLNPTFFSGQNNWIHVRYLVGSAGLLNEDV